MLGKPDSYSLNKRMARNLILFLFACILGCQCLFSRTLYATDYYATPGGNTSFPDCSNVNTPCNISTAMAGISGGDTLYLRAGIHTLSSSVRYSQDGTAASPIIIKNYPGEDAVIDGLVEYSIDIRGNYWHLLTSQTGSVTFNYRLTGIRVGWGSASNFLCDGWKFVGITPNNDNAGAIRLEYLADGFVIRNVEVDGPGADVNSNNGCLWVDNTGLPLNGLFENNELYDCPTGIYHKHSSGNGVDDKIVFSNNYIHDVGDRQALWITTRGAIIENNLLVGGLHLGHDGGTSSGDYNTIIHNTIVGGINYNWDSDDPPVYCAGNNFQDNLVVGESDLNHYADHGDMEITADYNLYPEGNVVWVAAGHLTLSLWRTFLGGCPGTDNECNSLSGAPTFVGGASPTTISGYALASGSLGKNSAGDGTDMGADITLVGVNSSGSSASAVCGNGSCETGETCSSCSVDCGACSQDNGGGGCFVNTIWKTSFIPDPGPAPGPGPGADLDEGGGGDPVIFRQKKVKSTLDAEEGLP